MRAFDSCKRVLRHADADLIHVRQCCFGSSVLFYFETNGTPKLMPEECLNHVWLHVIIDESASCSACKENAVSSAC